MTTAAKALPLWGLEGAEVTLIAARENVVYRVDHASGPLALRLHRRGYRTDAQLTAELDWMAWVAKSGLSVPAPKPSSAGPHLQIVDGVQVDVLTWLSGKTLDTALPKPGSAARARVFHALGSQMAKLHRASDTWPAATTCDRPAWDVDGLLGEAPLWDRFWDNPGLTPSQRQLFVAFRDKACAGLAPLAAALDYGLIHADLVPANVMIDGGNLHFIDFDDGGFGFRVFELATALLKYRSQPDFEVLKSALITGYTSQRPLDTRTLDLFLALRSATYVGWNITRAREDETGARNARFIAQAADLATAYLTP